MRHDERVQLPPAVKRIIEERAEEVGFPALKNAVSAMSDAYRDGRAGSLRRLAPAERAAAYLVTRMPATYAAAFAVLRELRNVPVASILDIGAGTGAASLAARHWFPGAAITMLEPDVAFAAAAHAFLPDARMISADVGALDLLPPHDLVIAAYSLGEVTKPAAHRLWQAAQKALAIIEPGTPAGFSLIREVRDRLLSAGARMIAPCPAESACPMSGADWCHFAARVERSSLHRRLKDARLNYEDEKFSYVALVREAAPLPEGRIIRHPQHHPGLIVLETCTPRGLETKRVTKRDREEFRWARQASWGDVMRGTLPSSPADDRGISSR